MLVYSFVESSPPYYAFGLFALDFSNQGLAWIAALTYGYKIAPSNLAATMAAIVNTMQYVLGKYNKYYAQWLDLSRLPNLEHRKCYFPLCQMT